MVFIIACKVKRGKNADESVVFIGVEENLRAKV
jgi:hypothetical protein